MVGDAKWMMANALGFRSENPSGWLKKKKKTAFTIHKSYSTSSRFTKQNPREGLSLCRRRQKVAYTCNGLFLHYQSVDKIKLTLYILLYFVA